MSASLIARRALLAGMASGAALAGSALPGAAQATLRPQPPFRAIGDVTRAGGRALQAAANNAGADFADPEGEIVRLLQGRAAQWLAPSSPVLVAGYTGWSDYLLAGDIAREAGRRVTLARLIGPAKARHLVAPRASAAAQNLLRTLCESCGDGGIAWILE